MGGFAGGLHAEMGRDAGNRACAIRSAPSFVVARSAKLVGIDYADDV